MIQGKWTVVKFQQLKPTNAGQLENTEARDAEPERELVLELRTVHGAPAMGRGAGNPGGTRRQGVRGAGRPVSTLPESPPGSERGSVRVNTAATAANTATLPQRPPERHGPAPAAGPPPSPWRPMGPDARSSRTATPRRGADLPGPKGARSPRGFRSSGTERTIPSPVGWGRRR